MTKHAIFTTPSYDDVWHIEGPEFNVHEFFGILGRVVREAEHKLTPAWLATRMANEFGLEAKTESKRGRGVYVTVYDFEISARSDTTQRGDEFTEWFAVEGTPVRGPASDHSKEC